MFLPEHFKKNTLQGNLGMVLDYISRESFDVNLVCRNIPLKETHNKDYLNKWSSKPIYSIYSLWCILRAEVLFIDTGTHIPGRYQVVQLWHGTGFKNIGFLNKTKRNRKNKKLFYSFEAEEKAKGKQIIFALSSSALDQEQKRISFQTDNVLITGSPVNDLLFKRDIEIKAIKRAHGLEGYQKIISYAPTYRDSNAFSPFTEKYLKTFSEWLVSNNYVFLVRTHPLDKAFRVGSNYPNIIDTYDMGLDLQSYLALTDLLISDYSSISTDFSLLERPIVFYIYDYEDYKKHSRDFYFDLDTVLPGPFCQSESEIIKAIDTEFEMSHRLPAYNKFSTMFHVFRDDNSSERTARKIHEIVLQNRIQ